MNRNYPFGWGSNIGVGNPPFVVRGSGPGSEPEVKNTMEIVQNNQVVNLVTQHSNSRAVFYPGLDIFAGDTPNHNNGFRDLALAMAAATNGGYTNVRRSALDYETSGETVDELVAAARPAASPTRSSWSARSPAARRRCRTTSTARWPTTPAARRPTLPPPRTLASRLPGAQRDRDSRCLRRRCPRPSQIKGSALPARR